MARGFKKIKMNTKQYFQSFKEEVMKVYNVAEEARARGFDPVDKVEIPLAMSMAEKVVGLISTLYPQMENSSIDKRILELEKKYGKLDPAVSIQIAEEVAKQKFCKFRNILEAIEAGARIGFAYMTLGVVSSPIEGLTEIKIMKTREGKEYLCPYFSGPVRSAGGTGAAFSLVIIDHLREIFGYEKYDPTEEEAKRTFIELTDYHERITNLQYMPTEEEALFLAKNIPLQISGEPSEKFEVSNYKNLERIDTNMLRSGFCLVIGEGLAQKAAKIQKYIYSLRKKGFKLTDWDFLEEYIKIHGKRGKEKGDFSPVYIKDLVAGRPVFGHPGNSGGFRFRYGRSRISGFSATSIHPATMEITDGFIATGTQLKLEKPTKGCIVTSCDMIDGPIIKLFNGSVKKIKSKEEAKKYNLDVEEIIYLGDMLFPFGDLSNRNAFLVKPGYVEEWWALDLRKKSKEAEETIDFFNISFKDALSLSRKFMIPLHPKFIFYWTEISKEEFGGLIEWLKRAKVDNKLIFPYTKIEQEKFKVGKRALELLGIEHDVTIENVVLNEENSRAFLFNLGINFDSVNENVLLKDIVDFEKFKGSNPLDIINSVCEVNIKDKAGEFIGSRMGRPEKAKLRKLTGSPNVLFPVGNEGGRFRSVQEACEVGKVRGSFPTFYCEECKIETIYPLCEKCEKKTKKQFYFFEKKQLSFKRELENSKGVPYYNRIIDIGYYFNKSIEKLGLNKEEIPLLVKGVRGLSSEDKTIENLSKGILRAKYDLQVNKDGTIRYDVTEIPLTAFKPKEIFVGVQKLKELGYNEDIYGMPLEKDDQILELKPHDILLPGYASSPEEGADNVFMRISLFIDEMLERIYGLKPIHNVRKREDLIGQLGVCMAPHNCAGVICRFIGFSNTLGLLASPFMHAAIRRDCVYPTTKIFFYNENNDEIFYDDIGNYVENLIKKGAKTEKIDSFGTISVENNKNIYALGIDPVTHELKKKKIKYFIKGPITREWIKVTTATNREYIMTPTHKFMYIEDEQFKFKEAKELKIDDKLPVLENFNFELDIKEVNLIELFKEKLSEKEKKKIFVFIDGKKINLSDFYKEKTFNKEISYHDIKLKYVSSDHKIPAIIPINENLIRFLGYYAAEGYSRTNKWVSQVSFRICNKDMQDHLIKLIGEVFGMKASLGEDNTKIMVCSKLVYYFIKFIGCGEGAYDKRVPRFFFGLNKDLVKEYISAYFDGDGSIIKGKNIVFYSVSRELLDDVTLLLSKFRVFGRYFRTDLRLPGKRVLDKYEKLGKIPKKHILNHLVLGVYDSFKLGKILNVINSQKSEKIKFLHPAEKRFLKYNGKQIPLVAKSDYVEDYVKKVEVIKEEKNSYCLEIEWKEKEDRNVLWGEQIINTRCDGDEAAIMLLSDVLLNFSRKFLPSHRGGTQDAPLVLNAKIDAGEVDEQILDFEVVKEYPLELYEAAERGEHSSKVKVYMVRDILEEGKDPFLNINFTHDTSNFNEGVLCSSYKTLATMQDKVKHQMRLVEKLRAADTSDTARLIIERHFIRDMKGNLRNFSIQDFRCVACNNIMRRPPLKGVCPECNGKIIFTVHEGGIKKYLEPALELAKKYNLSPYINQNLELVKRYIDSIFGKEEEKQEALKKWF